MADNKSCGDQEMQAPKPPKGKVTTLECFDCGYREVFTERQFKLVDGYSCDFCNGPVFPTETKHGEKIRNRRIKKQAIEMGELTAKLSIDVSDTLKGLKAVQREAKRATATLKEFEEQQNKNELFKQYYMCQWVDENGEVQSLKQGENK